MEQMDGMLSEVAMLKAIIREGIMEYQRINMGWLREIIDHLVDAHNITPEVNAAFSPPKKPNLSPIPSQKRLSSSSS